MSSIEYDNDMVPGTVTAPVLAGSLLMRNAFSSGNLTGRKTWYVAAHTDDLPGYIEKGSDYFTGSKERNARKILGSRLRAAIASENINGMRLGKKTSDEERLKRLGSIIKRYVTGSGMTKINTPVWAAEKAFAEAKNSTGASKVLEVLKKYTGPEYMPESSSYKRNSLKEIAQYIRGNKGRFSLGMLKLLAGASLAGYGLNAAYRGTRPKYTSDYDGSVYGTEHPTDTYY